MLSKMVITKRYPPDVLNIPVIIITRKENYIPQIHFHL